MHAVLAVGFLMLYCHIWMPVIYTLPLLQIENFVSIRCHVRISQHATVKISLFGLTQKRDLGIEVQRHLYATG